MNLQLQPVLKGMRVGFHVGTRMRELEHKVGEKLDDAAKGLLNYKVVRGPATRLANSRFAWSFARRVDRIRTRRRQSRVLASEVPHHVGIIMDGNRRFARELGLAHVGIGHVVGQERLEMVLDWCVDLGIRVLTVYAFSTENFSRADEERDLLMELFEHNFTKLATDERVHENQIRVRVIGELGLLPDDVQAAAKKVMEVTAHYSQYQFNVAVAYGGRQEIVDAVKVLARRVRDGTLRADDITPELIRENTYTPDLPDPDFIIRTSGEERISNFLLWQAAYSELYFADVYWPEFNKAEFLRAIEEFQHRARRFGK